MTGSVTRSFGCEHARTHTKSVCVRNPCARAVCEALRCRGRQPAGDARTHAQSRTHTHTHTHTCRWPLHQRERCRKIAPSSGASPVRACVRVRVSMCVCVRVCAVMSSTSARHVHTPQRAGTPSHTMPFPSMNSLSNKHTTTRQQQSAHTHTHTHTYGQILPQVPASEPGGCEAHAHSSRAHIEQTGGNTQ